ncbi:MAG: ABC transporter ATP-binding protein [Actinomycetaceae bacterium]|nr:ABC transporter ATP-binding protein [Actinomycetaceae bacterium]
MRDPIMLTDFARLTSDNFRSRYWKAVGLGVSVGAVEGITLVFMLPTLTAMWTGKTSWGLSASNWMWVLIVCAALGAALMYFQNKASYAVALDLMKTIHSRVGNKIATMPLGWFGPSVTGRLSRLVSDGVQNVGNALAGHLQPALRSVFAATMILLGSWLWQWELGATLTVSVPVLYLIVYIAAKIRAYCENLTMESEAEVANRIVEFATCQPALRASGRAQSFEKLDESIAEDRRAQLKSLWLGILATSMNATVVQAITVILIVLAGLSGGARTMTPIAAVAFIGMCLRFTKSLEDITKGVMVFEHVRADADALQKILDVEPLPEAKSDADLPEPGAVELRDVEFAYGDTKVIDGVSFNVQPGTLTAIVGPSGSGKTTIFRLISRFWDISEGEVLVGGADVRNQPTAQLMEQLSMVFQDVYLYDDTLEANIRVGRDDATDAEVREVAELAGVSEIAERLPKGWESPVGEGGNKLSGGERQRVSVARALLKNAPIVLFDEATSALDPENESHIEQSISRLRERATVLVIAHKLETVKAADQIVVLNDCGQVAEVGTHDELLASSGIYAEFWQARRQAMGWSLTAG